MKVIHNPFEDSKQLFNNLLGYFILFKSFGTSIFLYFLGAVRPLKFTKMVTSAKTVIACTYQLDNGTVKAPSYSKRGSLLEVRCSINFNGYGGVG